MAADSPPESPLSELGSDDFTEDVKTESRGQSVDIFPDHDHDRTTMRPVKRQKIAPARHDRVSYHDRELSEQPMYQEGDPELSEDTDGDVPASPAHPVMQIDDIAMGREQVSVCQWQGCTRGELGHVDALIRHIEDDHMIPRGKKWPCEWGDCQSKASVQQSQYALKAHMRSHTKEKPFYCALPECDRSFTRSDALAKHQRTVHFETMSLRPQGPPKPKQQSPTLAAPPPQAAASAQPARLKLVFNQPKPPPDALFADDFNDDKDAAFIPLEPGENDKENGGRSYKVVFPPDIHFEPEEASLPPKELYSLLRRQMHWAETENANLRAEEKDLEQKLKEEWEAKRRLLANNMDKELWKLMMASGNNMEVPNELMKDMPLQMQYWKDGKEDREMRWDRPAMSAYNVRIQAERLSK